MIKYAWSLTPSGPQYSPIKQQILSTIVNLVHFRKILNTLIKKYRIGWISDQTDSQITVSDGYDDNGYDNGYDNNNVYDNRIRKKRLPGNAPQF